MGAGPAVEKAFEARCGCDLKFVSVADGVQILNRVRLEGEGGAQRISCSASTRTSRRRPPRPAFSPPRTDGPSREVPVTLSDDIFVP